MKKASIFLLVFLMVFSIAACKEEDIVPDNGAFAEGAAEDEAGEVSEAVSDVSDISEGETETTNGNQIEPKEEQPADSLENVALGKKYTINGFYSDGERVYYGDTEEYKLTDGKTGEEREDSLTYMSSVWIEQNLRNL